MTKANVRIEAGGEVLGGGLFVLSDVIATAYHCIGDPSPHEEFTVLTSDHQRFPLRRIAGVREKDIAILQATLPEDDIVSRADLPAIPYVGAPWRSPYRHPDRQVSVSGTVTDLLEDFECEAGGEIRAVQLDVKPALDTYGGFSGGSVFVRSEVNRGMDTDLRFPFGILIEQRMRMPPLGAADVTFAADLREFIETFDELRSVSTTSAKDEELIDKVVAQLKREVTGSLVEPGLANGNLPSLLENLVREHVRARAIEGNEQFTDGH